MTDLIIAANATNAMLLDVAKAYDGEYKYVDLPGPNWMAAAITRFGDVYAKNADNVLAIDICHHDAGNMVSPMRSMVFAQHKALEGKWGWLHANAFVPEENQTFVDVVTSTIDAYVRHYRAQGWGASA